MGARHTPPPGAASLPLVASGANLRAVSYTPGIAHDLQLPQRGVEAVLKLVEDGATVPFMARYRKEATGGFDEVQIRAVCERLDYLKALDARRQTILAAIAEQGELNDGLRRRLQDATTKTELEDLYLPFKKKRKTRASVARERGLEPLARLIWSQPGSGNPAQEARRYVRGEVTSAQDALAGARDIVAERVAEDARVRQLAREQHQRWGVVVSKPARGKKDERSRFDQYKDFREPVGRIPSHRYLAIARGENEGLLAVKVQIEEDRLLDKVLRTVRYDRRSPFGDELHAAVTDGLKRLANPSVEKEVRADLKARADQDAVNVFARNLEQLLLLPPVGARGIVGIDPGIRTGCKCVFVDKTGKVVEYTTINPSRDVARATQEAAAFIKRHRPFAVAVGNGTYGRETQAVVRDALQSSGQTDVVIVEVNEAGASVYSASDLARAELPDLDVTVRGAVSIARRLQDPLAELVKIDPKSIGVGQYQHDVKQSLLQQKLGDVVQDCVNRVGVELNTASGALLSYVAGIGPTAAARVVAHRQRNGAFRKRKDLLAVQGLGPKTFEQAAGFLRVRNSSEALDASAVHPERYGLVATIARDLNTSVASLVGNPELVDRIDIRRYIGPDVGEPTLRHIIAELKRPGRDPRPPFEPPKRRDDVRTMDDLHTGMVLEGVVTNVTAFGAFVDVGVKQDGLVHVSQLSDRFIRDPAEAVSVGDRLPVRVLEVDLERRRISLSAKNLK